MGITQHDNMAHAVALRQAMRSSCVALPGTFNGLVGRMAADIGFEGVYISGAGVTASLGQPDVGLASLQEFTKIIREISVCSGLPIIADADTGFGEEEMVTKTVNEYWHAGASGMHIEDQVGSHSITLLTLHPAVGDTALMDGRW